MTPCPRTRRNLVRDDFVPLRKSKCRAGLNRHRNRARRPSMCATRRPGVPLRSGLPDRTPWPARLRGRCADRGAAHRSARARSSALRPKAAAVRSIVEEARNSSSPHAPTGGRLHSVPRQRSAHIPGSGRARCSGSVGLLMDAAPASDRRLRRRMRWLRVRSFSGGLRRRPPRG